MAAAFGAIAAASVAVALASGAVAAGSKAIEPKPAHFTSLSVMNIRDAIVVQATSRVAHRPEAHAQRGDEALHVLDCE